MTNVLEAYVKKILFDWKKISVRILILQKPL